MTSAGVVVGAVEGLIRSGVLDPPAGGQETAGPAQDEENHNADVCVVTQCEVATRCDE